ncbi:MAG TPA: hypothetical protein VFP87_09630 [Chitinophagaceae bacterium]|nr:hypothetical protein [Chitinophagaceae bacterium]
MFHFRASNIFDEIASTPSIKASSKKSAGNVRKVDSSTAKETKIKYSDKSHGQPDLVPIFEEIKKLLLPYEKGTMRVTAAPGQVVLISQKPVEIIGRKKDELWFASALVQKGYVGFY